MGSNLERWILWVTNIAYSATSLSVFAWLCFNQILSFITCACLPSSLDWGQVSSSLAVCGSKAQWLGISNSIFRSKHTYLYSLFNYLWDDRKMSVGCTFCIKCGDKVIGLSCTQNCVIRSECLMLNELWRGILIDSWDKHLLGPY